MYSNATLTGEVKDKSINGVLEFSDYIVTQKPGSIVLLELEIDLGSMGQKSLFLDDSVILKTKQCQTGEIET